MKKLYFQISLNLIIIIILSIWLLWNYIIFTNLNELEKLGQNTIYILFIGSILLETLFINRLISDFYNRPIIKLEYVIKSFIVGKLKNKEIRIKNSLNPNLNYISNFFSKTLNTLKDIKDEFIHGKEIKWEVAIWKEIQSKMLDKKSISIPSLHVIAKSKPAWEIWWDSYDTIRQGDNYYTYVWDATWHWVWAWVIMMMVNSLISWFSKVFKSWAQILSNTNEILKPRVKTNLLMSLLMIRWDEKEKRLFMTWAWHEYLLIYKNKEKKCFKIKSGWVALWMVKDISKIIKEREIKFEENDILILYSDWITEAINQPKRDWNEVMFWEDRLVQAIEKTETEKNKQHKSAQNVFNRITIELSKFMWYNFIQLDDITLAVIQYKSKNSDKTEGEYKKVKDDFITQWNW